MILYRVLYKHPTLGGEHVEKFHTLKEDADRHERSLEKRGVPVTAAGQVVVPTEQGREALADWLNKRYCFLEDEFSRP